MTWIKQNETPLPFNTRIIATDGRVMCVITVIRRVSEPLDSEQFWYTLNPEAISGYEWEVDFAYRDITHWMLAPELPKL